MKSRESPTLNENEVHIWSASLLEDKKNVDYFYSVLSEDERERAGSFRLDKDQRRFTMARGILRVLLSAYLAQPPESIEILYGLWGKPCLPDEESLNFNVSHSGDYALYAVARSDKVGIDLEYIDKNLELEEMAPHVFSEVELENWHILDREERVSTFFKRWVSMEAFLKASGKGWLEDIIDARNSFEKGSLNDAPKKLYCFECIPGYTSAVFLEGTLLRSLHYSWEKSNLMFLGESK